MKYQLTKHDGRSCELSADEMRIITTSLAALAKSDISYRGDVTQLWEKMMKMRNQARHNMRRETNNAPA